VSVFETKTPVNIEFTGAVKSCETCLVTALGPLTIFQNACKINSFTKSYSAVKQKEIKILFCSLRFEYAKIMGSLLCYQFFLHELKEKNGNFWIKQPLFIIG